MWLGLCHVSKWMWLGLSGTNAWKVLFLLLAKRHLLDLLNLWYALNWLPHPTQEHKKNSSAHPTWGSRNSVGLSTVLSAWYLYRCQKVKRNSQVREDRGLPWRSRGWLHAPNARGLGLIPHAATKRSHMPQLRVCKRVCMPQLKILRAIIQIKDFTCHS